MRFVVYGAGAIGGVLGGRLAEHGADVTLIARGAHLEAILERGLTVESPDATVTVRARAVGTPREAAIGEGDVVVLAMKSQDTVAALEALVACAPPSTTIVCAQNGVDNERSALRHFEHVYGMCVMCPASHLEPGVVQASSSPVTGLMDVGRWPKGRDEVADRIARTLSSATFSSVPREDIARWKWGKLLMNLGNAVEAVCRPRRVRSRARRAGARRGGRVPDRGRRRVRLHRRGRGAARRAAHLAPDRGPPPRGRLDVAEPDEVQRRAWRPTT